MIFFTFLLLYLRYEKSGNEALSKALTQWVFKETGVLRAGNITHHKKGESTAPEAYIIMDEVVL